MIGQGSCINKDKRTGRNLPVLFLSLRQGRNLNMRKVFIGLLFISMLTLAACNFGNPAGIMKEWDALLNEVGIQTENILLPTESEDVEITSITYEYSLDEHIGTVIAAFILDNELIQYEASPKTDKT